MTFYVCLLAHEGVRFSPFSAKPIVAPILCQSEINLDFDMFDSSIILLITGPEELILAVRLFELSKTGATGLHKAFSNQSINNRGSLKRGGARKRVASLPLLLPKKQKKDPC
ncbi:MAG: hypothetical protein ACKO5C_08805 [Ferruginibacter sp.]